MAKQSTGYGTASPWDPTKPAATNAAPTSWDANPWDMPEDKGQDQGWGGYNPHYQNTAAPSDDGDTPPPAQPPPTEPGAPAEPPPPATTNTDPYANIPGFDYTKLTGNTGSAGKYTAAVKVFSQGLGSGVQIARGQLDPMIAYAKAHGFANAKAVGDDKIDFGDGNGPIDVITSNGGIWFQNGEDRFGGGAGTGGVPTTEGTMTNGAGGAGGGGGGSSSSSSSSSSYGPPAGINEELWAMLMQRAKQGTTVGRDDPNIRAQADAYSAQEERARRNYLGDMAEEGSPYNTGAQAGLERMTAESMGQRVGGMESELVGREITARRQEIQSALDSMGNLMTEQQRQSLQKELATMDDATRRLQIGNQNSQFYAGLSQADQQFMAQLAQQGRFKEMDEFFRRAQLDQNDTQFRDQMGFQTREQQAYWDWRQAHPDSA